MLEKLPPPPQGREGWPWTEAAPPLPERAPDGSAWPRVTVVTPSYNQATFIEETIRSVLLQGYPNLEYIIVDGGSTDGSADIIARYADHLTWWVSEPDEGQSDAINKGFRRATGDIVAWLNSDDVYVPGALAESAGYLAQHPEIDVVYGDVRFIGPDGAFRGIEAGNAFSEKRLFGNLFSLTQPTAFVRRSSAERVGLLRTDLHYIMDLEWWLRLAANGARFAYHAGERAIFRFHSESKTVSQEIRFATECDLVVSAFYADPALPDRLRKWERRARSSIAVRYGKALLSSGERGKAFKKLLKGLPYALPSFQRTTLILIMLLDALTGWNLRELGIAIKYKLEGRRERIRELK
jgi:glycosyltransferase involved in cell wall biosynthesis